MSSNKHNSSRRAFVKRAAYAAPVVLSLKAVPSFAMRGSYKKPHGKDDDHGHHGYDRRGGRD